MKTRIAYRRAHWLAVVLCVAWGMPWRTPDACGQILLVDEFDGTRGDPAFHPGGVVDVTTYRVPFGGTNGDDFVGRTNFRFTLPQDGVTTLAPGSTDGKVAVLNLDTYNPGSPGASFLGSDVITKRNFGVGGGLRMTTRMRVQAGTPGGLVAAPFLYDVQRESPPGTLVRDEIDHEIITNFAQSAGPDNTLTNVWNDGNFASQGAPVTINNPSGFDVTQFHNYRTDWTPSSVKYYIDDTLVRTETSVVPNDPMKAHINFWAPDSTFGAAYNAALTPSATSPGSTYQVEVDRLQIERLNTSVSANLLADASFESFDAVPGGNGGWNQFGNVFRPSGPVPPQDGFQSLKMFGPFFALPNASGVFQNVPASPGQEFEGSVYAYSQSSDSILGTQNFTKITLQFLNAAGQVLDSVNFSPGRNEKDTPIFDGRDPNMVQNQWIQYTVNAIAPADTAFVRESLFFIQNLSEGGAVWFDNASLVRLIPDIVAVPGDYNGNGVVDAADYVVFRNSFGQTAAGLPADGNNNGTIDNGDYTFWKERFGNTAASSSGALSVTVPEPSAWLVAALAVLMTTGLWSRRP